MTNQMLVSLTFWLLFSLISGTGDAKAATITGAQTTWQPLQLDVVGPSAKETDVSPNPFLDIRLDVIFTSPTGENFIVPGFFAGNGAGVGEGNIWRARFTPDQPGQWQYRVRLLGGQNVAVAQETIGFESLPASDDTGEFIVAPADSDAPGFLGKGRLNYVGEHYLQFTNGNYWVKAGVDSPENFFGYAGFDNTINQPGGVGEAQLVEGVHRYTDHIDDWQLGDPLFVSEDTGIDSKGIIGAINYLASEGVNSMYFLLMNLGGDGRETYPFIGTTGSDYDNTHYDISKLHQWNTVLQHMQNKSIAAHIVLGEQEQDNKNWLDGGELGIQRRLYYRELAARFAYLNALKWNLSEESRYGDERHLAFADTLRSVDWARHPIAVHSFVDAPAKAYDALLGNDLFSISSIQFSAENADEFTETWREKSRNAGLPWVIDMDEVGPGNTGLTTDNADQLRREVLYPVYFSGGNIEWYFGFQGADIRTENFRTREPMYRFMRYAREFIEQHLPFPDMQAMDDLLVGASTNDQVFADPGNTYAIYLNSGNREPSLQVSKGDYTLQWFNPRNGEFDERISMVTGDTINIGTPPDDPEEDWVVLIKLAEQASQTIDKEIIDNMETQTNAIDVTTESTEATTNATTNIDNIENELTENTDESIANIDNASTSPELGEANAESSGGGLTDWWMLIATSLLLLFRLLLCFRRWCVLTIGSNVLRIQSVEIHRVE